MKNLTVITALFQDINTMILEERKFKVNGLLTETQLNQKLRAFGNKQNLDFFKVV